jgi:hypothetical protein
MARRAKQHREAAARLRADCNREAAAVQQELYIVHRALARGCKLISINKAMELGGCKPNGHPTLAIANASARWAWFVRDADWIHDVHGFWKHPAVAFVSDWADNPGWDEKTVVNSSRTGDRFRFISKHFHPRMSELRIVARVPTVPAKFIPRDDLRNYVILWEADWQRAPKDPLLLKRVTREWYVVVAEWNMTSIERIVLEMAAFAGE